MKLYVGGLGLRGDGYPNAARTIRLLKQQDDLDIINCGRWLPEDLHLWKLASMPRWLSLRWLLVLVFGNLHSLLRVTVRVRKASESVYVPYPGIFFLFWASMIPRRWRPRCIVDSYISIWDSMFRDRAASQSPSLAATLLKRIEAHALRAAAVVLVDTEANRDFAIDEFGLDAMKVRSMPLAIEQNLFSPAPLGSPKPLNARIRVLFVGTLIPLHGIQAVLDAFAQLANDSRFEFRLIGDGQQADHVLKFVTAHPDASITWIREWCPLHRLAQEMLDADICLGVFGGREKAARVLPYKLYMYLACGKPVISQSALSTPAGVPFPPIVAVEPQPSAIVAAIRRLADDQELRDLLGVAAADFFQQYLANREVVKAWREIVR